MKQNITIGSDTRITKRLTPQQIEIVIGLRVVTAQQNAIFKYSMLDGKPQVILRDEAEKKKLLKKANQMEKKLREKYIKNNFCD